MQTLQLIIAFYIFNFCYSCPGGQRHDYRLFIKDGKKMSRIEQEFLFTFKNDNPEITAKPYKLYWTLLPILKKYEDMGFNNLKLLMYK